ncbi:uncharacterized protein LOC111073915 [Drosophila obscura]|uniref:uncharacterized protein LOC111073915 n=1 Tax=Drosophila obscura TaxID=7282 RepID=UPI001BB273E0|nr:uncharacterized protein LOC111073915 [Drosophila obscura]XP_022222170.2 uncharacterized protein LOC111073915 [Drosophila obscura]
MERTDSHTRVGMSTQTSVESVAATTGGHVEEQSSLRVASGHTSDMAGTGHISCNATATKTHSKLSHTGAVVVTDSDLESVLSASRMPEDTLLRSLEPGTSSLRREGPKRSKEGMKAKAQYKAALKIQKRLQGREDITKEEKSKLAWAEQKVEEGRLHFAQMPQMKASNGGFANKVEEMLATKRQRSTESAIKDTPASKRQRCTKDAGPPPKTAKKPNHKAKVNEVSKRHLIVALIDRSDENGKMTAARWKMVHARLVESLFARMEKDPTAHMPTFDGAGWLNGVKILKCMDDPTLKWLKQTVCQLEAMWEGAKLEVVDRELIPSIPKAKVLFPIAIQGDRALKLLQRQNPDVPTANWRILHIASPLPNEGGQCAILQISKQAEDLLYPRFGKMAWGMGSVYVRLKKRHPEDKDAHTLLAGEVEKDLGLDTIVEAGHGLDDSEEDGDLTVIVKPSSNVEPATHDNEAQSS